MPDEVTSSGEFKYETPAHYTEDRPFNATSEGNIAFQAAHKESDVDTERQAFHHTLGRQHNQAAPGDDFKSLEDAVALIRAQAMPVGEILVRAGSNTPVGTLYCNGAAVSRTTYATLFAEIGTTYGVGDGSTTFNLPDGRNRLFLGSLSLTDLTNDGLSSTTSRLNLLKHEHSHAVVEVEKNPLYTTNSAGGHNHGGDTGEKDLSQVSNTENTGASNRLTNPASHSHTISNDGGHTHTLTGELHKHDVAVGETTTEGTTTPLTLSHPYQKVNYFIRYTSEVVS